MAENKTKNVPIIYHFTCEYHLQSIFEEKFIKVTTSNFDLENFSKYPVVWLTTSQKPENMGLLFDSNIPDEFNKTHIRITLNKRPYMKSWDKWSDEKGMDKKTKRALIESARAHDTYKTWCVSESKIHICEILAIENLKTGEVYYKK